MDLTVSTSTKERNQMHPLPDSHVAAVLTFISANDVERDKLAVNGSAEQLAELLSGAIHLQHAIASAVLPAIDRTVRARWLDHGSTEFEHTYRRIGLDLHGEHVPQVQFSPTGYLAELEAERALMEQTYRDAHTQLERNWVRLQARTDRLIAALSAACEGVLDVSAVIRRLETEEASALADGILDPTSRSV